MSDTASSVYARVLIVEDSESDLFFTQEFFSARDIEADMTHKKDGQEAISYMQSLLKNNAPLPHFIFLDLNMPRMDGTEFAKAFREYKEFDLIPIIVLSSLDHPHKVEILLDMDVSGFVAKPLDDKKFDHILKLIKPLAIEQKDQTKKILSWHEGNACAA